MWQYPEFGKLCPGTEVRDPRTNIVHRLVEKVGNYWKTATGLVLGDDFFYMPGVVILNNRKDN